MKKYLALMGAAVLIMALAMPAGAQMLTKSWGHIEFQTVYEVNPDFKTGGGTYRESTFGAPGRDITYKRINERFRFYLQHGDDKTVKAVIGFEADSTDWGEAAPVAGDMTGGKMGRYTADTVQLEIKWAYLEFVIPNTPVTVAVGIQPWNYGGRFFVNNDAAGVKVTTKFAPHQVEVGWWRENDNSRTGTEIYENYAVDYNLKQKDFNVNVWAVYVNKNLGFIQDHPWYLGVAGGFKPGNFDLSGQIAYIGGTQEDRATTLIKKDYSAFAAEVLGYYQIGPGLKAGAEFFYSTGNDANNQSTKINMWRVATSSEARSGFGNDRTVFFWMASGVIGYYHNKETSFDGFWYGRLTGEYSPTKWLNLIFNYLYIQDTSTGTPGAGKIVNSTTTSGTQVKDLSGVGQEINVIAKLNIYKGFGWNIGLAYFIPGDIYDLYDASGNKTRSADPAWALNTKMIYNF